MRCKLALDRRRARPRRRAEREDGLIANELALWPQRAGEDVAAMSQVSQRLLLALALVTAPPGARALDTALCAVCYHSMLLLGDVHNKTKSELELSKQAADMKAKKVDKVQKAQTKRWLKNEYKVALAASVEDRLEKVCADDGLVDVLCDLPPEQRREHWEELGKRGSGLGECRKLGAERCKALTDERAEELARAALDEKGWPSCAKLVKGCEPEALEEDEDAADDDEAAVETVPVPVRAKDEV